MAVVAPFDPLGLLQPGVTLIEASAGTGKTYTMTSLMLRLILEEGLTIDQVLVVTFTEAATAELRDRTRQRFRQTLVAFRSMGAPQNDPLVSYLLQRSKDLGRVVEDTRRLEDALRDFDRAVISTIHGFCNRVLKSNAFESGVSFGAELLREEGSLREEVVRDFWINELHNAPLEFYQFLVSGAGSQPYHKLDLGRLTGLGALVCSQREMPVLPVSAKGPETPPSRELWREAVDLASTIIQNERQRIGALLNFAHLTKQFKNKVPAYLDELSSWLSGTERSPMSLPQAAGRLSSSYLKSKTKKGKTTVVHPLFDSCEVLCTWHDQQKTYLEARAVELSLRFVDYALEETLKRKRARSVQSFDDLLFNLADALRGSSGEQLTASLSHRFKAVLIDEFQDTDPIQYDIFHRLFSSVNPAYAFLIGDPKQAIYSFRGADVYAYLRAVSAAEERCFTLETNWRSDLRLVQAMEHLFGRIDAPFVEENIGFVPVGASKKGDGLVFPKGICPPLCIRFLKVEDAPGGVGRGAKVQRIGRRWLSDNTPALVACEVAELLESGASIDGRPLEPGHIAVLVRKNEQARQVQGALRELQVPSVLHGAASVFHTVEAFDFRLILAAVSEPSNPRRIKEALASETLGFLVGDLAKLDQDEQSWDAQLDRFRDLHRLWKEQGFVTMARALIEGEGIPESLLSRVDGERRLTNLLHLVELLHLEEYEQRLGMAGLTRWLDNRCQDGGEDRETAQLRLESDEGAVQLVTIHKAKGLQYPVVICPYLWDGMSLHPIDKVFPRFHDPDDDLVLKIDVGSDAHSQHVERANYEARAEGLRLLYVALTRAQHRCILFTGALADIESSPLGYILHAQPGLGGGPVVLETFDALCKKTPAEQLYQETEALGAGSCGTIEVTPLVSRSVTPYVPPAEAPPALRTRRFSRQLELSWRTASFSSLTSSMSFVGSALQKIEQNDDIPKVPLHDFPRGTEAGICLHAILETVDFPDEDTGATKSIVESHLEGFGFSPEEWSERVTFALDEVRRTLLDADGDLKLSLVPRERRLDELEFIFPVAQGRGAKMFRREAFAELVQRHRSPSMPAHYPELLARLSFEPLKGFLKGFIDLIFEHQGRWFVVDYKSNHLGDVHGDYDRDSLIEAMTHHHYYVQYLLYTVALHRYLSWRLPGYDYDGHFGGVYYLFLRGMSPATGTDSGVFYDRPSRGLIEGISDLLEKGGM